MKLEIERQRREKAELDREKRRRDEYARKLEEMKKKQAEEEKRRAGQFSWIFWGVQFEASNNSFGAV